MKLSTQEGRAWSNGSRAHSLPRGRIFAPSRVNQVVIVLLVAWVVRFLFAAFMPADARAADTFSWEAVAHALNSGQNPYKETTFLNWPPIWMQLIYLMSKIATALNVPFIHVLQVFLTSVESVVIVALFRLIWEIDAQARTFGPMLLGYALNPTAIFLTCQHGNFDILIALFVLLFVGQLVRYQRSQNEMDWLAACLWLGLGIVTKTVPLVLCPMLAGGWKRTGARTRVIGSALVFGPVILGMSIIYVLAPADVAAKVIDYRSGPAFFGISGILALTHFSDFVILLTQKLFYILLATAGLATARLFWKRERMEPHTIILCAAMFLAVIPGVGPGYSPQYLSWFLPLLIASYVLHTGSWRWVLLAFWLVCALTCIVEYGIFPSHGMYLYYLVGDLSARAVDLLTWWSSRKGEIVLRLPLFAMFLMLLAAGIRLLLREFRAESRATDAPAEGAGSKIMPPAP